MRYRVLDDIVFYEPVMADGVLVASKTPKSATPGDVVEIADKDATPLLKRGAIVKE